MPLLRPDSAGLMQGPKGSVMSTTAPSPAGQNPHAGGTYKANQTCNWRSFNYHANKLVHKYQIECKINNKDVIL